jgi:putative membrane protein
MRSRGFGTELAKQKEEFKKNGMKKKDLFWLLLPGVLLAGACDNDDDNDMGRMQNQEFVTMAASSNRFEIEAGELAGEQGADERVIEYGNHMVMDHGAAGVELAALATAKDWSIPDDLLAKEQEMLEDLMVLEGAAFDQEFARKMVLSHQEAVSLFERASGPDGVIDGDLKEWASEKLPTLRAHLEGAQELDAQINP